MKRIILILLLLLLAACGGQSAEDDNISTDTEETQNEVESEVVVAETEEPADEAPTAEAEETEPESTEAVEPEPTEVVAPTAESEKESIEASEVVEEELVGDVTFTADDGLPLVGTFQSGAGDGPRPTVLLLHMLNSNRQIWGQFSAELNGAGYNTLALDMRGHGESGTTRDWELARADLQLVLDSLANRTDVDSSQMAIIGGSIGSNMALIAGAADQTITTVVLLSPGLDYRGVETQPAMEGMGNRPVLIVASNEDSYSADSSRTLFSLARAEQSQLELYDLAGHGTNMFLNEPGLSDLILDWLMVHIAG